MRSWHTLVAILALSLLPLLAQATVQASLDRNAAHLGETVTLNLHSDSAPITAPDLSALAGDFQVLGQSSGTTSSFVNGQRTVDYSYGVALRPLHEGTLRIPSLTIGNEQTRPLTLQVSAPNPADAQVHGPVFVEARFDPQQPYVGQQVALSVKLYYTTNLANASLSDPAIDGADINRLGNDIDYQAQRNGRTYNVIERRYAVVPQKSGELTLPPIQFQGDLLDPNDPDSFLGMGSPVQAQSRPLTLHVRPAPAGWGASAWLPARQLALGMDGLPDATSPARVGQPFNLTLHLDATGLSFEALPSLILPSLDGATAYPDKPVTGNRVDGGWITGHREHRFAIVPSRAGPLTLPAVTVKWWNVVTDQAETATIPSHTIQVLPAIGAATPPAGAASAPPSAATSAAPEVAPASRVVPAARSPWMWIALAVGALWLLTLAALLWRRRGGSVRTVESAGPERGSAVNPAARREAFLRAAREGDAAVRARTLLAWAQAERPGLRHLEAVACALDSDEQRAAIAALERACYGAAASGPSTAVLEAAFARGFAWRDERTGPPDDAPLPPLYPFKLR
ncbi:MAG: BatD family protein [Xanthomonadaceae bacterium]|nr:BatD family protein [Xanthomonadaceae bacterium]MDE1962557.1 protein BatD [Xanthomonadaceae bacterium]